MKERPILFSASMVGAILSGQKTVTRRPVKPQPSLSTDDWVLDAGGTGKWMGSGPSPATGGIRQTWGWATCPYGQPGDRLWVRESFWGCDLPGHGDQPCVVYDDEWHGKEYKPAAARPWARKFGRIPSIHMPRDASRILLEITVVRIERLHDIDEDQAQAEGIGDHEFGCGRPTDLDGYPACSCGSIDYIESFQSLWLSTGGNWDANPWVWVVEFKRVTP